jgi:hypothetical protein
VIRHDTYPARLTTELCDIQICRESTGSAFGRSSHCPGGERSPAGFWVFTGGVSAGRRDRVFLRFVTVGAQLRVSARCAFGRFGHECAAGSLGRAGPGGELLPDDRDVFATESDGSECPIGQLV